MSIAAQATAAVIKRRMLREVVLKDDKAFERLYGDLQTAMTNAWSAAMREAIAGALDRLKDLGAGKFTQDDAAMLMRGLEASVGPDAIRAAMRDPIVNLTDAIFRAGAEEVGKSAGVSIAFGRPDLDALDVLKTGNLYWVGNSWNVTTQNLMATALNDYFDQGMTRDQLTARFAEDFGTLTERGQRYWELLADHTATKTREVGRVTGYERAGVVEVQVRAQLDDKTSRICRDMHGRVIAVTALRAQADEYLAAASTRNEPAAKAAWLMHGEKTDFSNTATAKLGKGTAGPPYHFRCRTITVMFVKRGTGQLADWTRAAYDREPLSRSQVAKVVKRAKGAEWSRDTVARRHFGRNGPSLGLDTNEAFGQSALGLIDGGGRDVYLAIRKGKLNAVFAKPARRANTGEEGFAVTVVDLDDSRLVTHQFKTQIKTTGDDVPAQLQPRGIAKWLFG